MEAVKNQKSQSFLFVVHLLVSISQPSFQQPLLHLFQPLFAGKNQLLTVVALFKAI